jgi:hypothetical protein
MVEGQQEQVDKLQEQNEEARANTKAGLEQIQYTMWRMCGQEQDGVVPSAASPPRTQGTSSSGPSLAAHPYWKACHGAVGGILPVDSSLDYCTAAPGRDPNRYDYDGTSMHRPAGGPHDFSSGSHRHNTNVENTGSERRPKSRHATSSSDVAFEWRVPPSLEDLRSDVKESAKGVYRLGHAWVEDMAEQVHWAAERANPQFARRLTCTVLPEDLSFDNSAPMGDPHHPAIHGDDADDFYGYSYHGNEMKE